MKRLEIKNPFGASVYHAETVSSTFDTARLLAGQGEKHGAVISADFQEAGRGRLKRPWAAGRGQNLLFTILLRYADFSAIPEALTLRTGLAVSLALEGLVPELAAEVKVKWPNDIMIRSRKAAGILTESDGRNVYIGVGVNVYQEEFPPGIASKVISLRHAFPGLPGNFRFLLLERILSELYAGIEEASGGASWRERLDSRLYKKGEAVVFAPGKAGSGEVINGTLSGLGPGGELLIIPDGEEKETAFVNGELRVYSC